MPIRYPDIKPHISFTVYVPDGKKLLGIEIIYPNKVNGKKYVAPARFRIEGEKNYVEAVRSPVGNISITTVYEGATGLYNLDINSLIGKEIILPDDVQPELIKVYHD